MGKLGFVVAPRDPEVLELISRLQLDCTVLDFLQLLLDVEKDYNNLAKDRYAEFKRERKKQKKEVISFQHYLDEYFEYNAGSWESEMAYHALQLLYSLRGE